MLKLIERKVYFLTKPSICDKGIYWYLDIS